MYSIRLFSLLFTAVMAFNSCSKDSAEPSEKETPGESAFFSAKVESQAFPTPDIQFTYAKFLSSTKMLQILGQPADRKETIVLSLMPFNNKVVTAADWKPGTYNFDPSNIANQGFLASAEYNKWNGSSYDQWFASWDFEKTGKITILSNTGSQIKGSFSFAVVRKNPDGSINTGSAKKITEGSFDLTIK